MGSLLVLTASYNHRPGQPIPIAATVNSSSNPADPPRVPKMWLPKAISTQRAKDYDPIRKKLFTDGGIIETSSLLYQTGAFRDMLKHFETLSYDSLDVLFAIEKKRLTLIYRPVNKTKVLGYYILPDGAKAFDPALGKNQITKAEAKILTDVYENESSNKSVMTILKGFLDPNDDFNRPYQDPQSNYLNTLSIRYDREALDEFISEIPYQEGARQEKVTGIKAMFCSVGPSGYTEGTYPGTHKNRLMVVFEFTRKKGANDHDIFYIEDTPGFGQRERPVPNKAIKFGWKLALIGMDNGQLCPAHCPDSTASN